MKMNLLALAATAVALTFGTGCRTETFCWSWWANGEDAGSVRSGCQLGIAGDVREMTGAQVELLWGRAEKVNGAQVAIGYCNAAAVRNGPQVSVVNIAREGAALQFGLLNFNRDGFLPFFPFFNFSPKYFGGRNR